MANEIKIKSYKGMYSVNFVEDIETIIGDFLNRKETVHYLIDSNLLKIYPTKFKDLISSKRVILIEASEFNKSVEKVMDVAQRLIDNKIRRNHLLCAIGGGVLQDITCFISSILFRGMKWEFMPTTLLAQADSCIGSKSSINMSNAKNIIGTFWPPSNINICTDFLQTLKTEDMLSGIGEILKVHAIAGKESFDLLGQDFSKLLDDFTILKKYIYNSLLIKRKYIELDEFDQNKRLIFNYGHSFGHGIESATNFMIPHGIAVAIGMDMANDVSESIGLLPSIENKRMHLVLRKVYDKYLDVPISTESLISAMLKDKKNTSENLMLILATGERSEIKKIPVLCDDLFIRQCDTYLQRRNRL